MASSSSLLADQLRMKGLQLDDVSMKKLELDMREEVLHIFELEMQIFDWRWRNLSLSLSFILK